MNKIFTISVLSLFLWMFPGLSSAKDNYHVSGKLLISYCKDTLKMMDGQKYNASRSSWCLGFIQASVMSHRFYTVLHTINKPEHASMDDKALMQVAQRNRVYCVPSRVPLGQVVQDVVQFLQRSPKYQNDPASVGVARALRKTYPCKD